MLKSEKLIIINTIAYIVGFIIFLILIRLPNAINKSLFYIIGSSIFLMLITQYLIIKENLNILSFIVPIAYITIICILFKIACNKYVATTVSYFTLKEICLLGLIFIYPPVMTVGYININKLQKYLLNLLIKNN